jgi:Asp-tRNA(Asn)/Glu-tRNA(Gln) amidotransferase A subunit family amidase
MIAFQEYVSADATAWADRVRRGEVTAAEVLEAAIARAEAVNPRINAISTRIYEHARESAKRAPGSGPLAGVPWAMKDMSQTMQGVPLTNGSRSYIGFVGAEDSVLVQRFRAAGLNIFCTTTAPEFGAAATTESTLHGATRNPWNLSRTSGGSSGGASALVAAGVLPAAHATDGGGSIRGPAACCGLFGLKPSRGRVPIAPGRTEGWFGCSVSHAVTRSVRDSAVILDVSHGPEPGSRYIARPPKGTFSQAVRQSPGRLRVAFHWQTRDDVVPDPECIAGVEAAAKLCEELGHFVEPAAPSLDHRSLAVAFGRMVAACTAAAAHDRARGLGVDVAKLELEQVTREYLALADRLTALDMLAVEDTFQTAALTMSQFQDKYDVVLTPTMGRPPVPLGTACLMQSAKAYAEATIPFSCFTALANETGQPAMTVPLHWSKDGLPIGAQFAARTGEEELLFSLAAQLEQARPWFSKMAPEFT